MFLSIKNFFISIYEILKRKTIGAYVRIKNWIVDTSTGEAFKMFLTDSVCGHGTSSKPSTLKEKAVKALKFFGLGFAVSTALIVLAEGIAALSFIYLLKVMALWYLCSLIFQAAIYQYKSFDWVFDKAPVSNGVAEAIDVPITYDQTPASDEKLQAGLEALASFVAKYSSKGSLVTADVMYMAFVCDPNMLPQGYKRKLYSSLFRYQEELLALSLKVKGTELIPLKQSRSFYKERMFTSDSVYSKARYSNEFYEMVNKNK